MKNMKKIFVRGLEKLEAQRIPKATSARNLRKHMLFT